MRKNKSKVYSEKNKNVLKRKSEIFIGYLPVGYPDSESFLSIIQECEKSGVDIFEIGYPPQDAFADGEVIKNAFESVDYDNAKDISYWKKIRVAISAPIWIMGYSHDLILTGDYLNLAKSGVVDGFVIPDIDNNKYVELSHELQQYGVDVVCFVRNDTADFDASFSSSSLIYFQLVNGKTGSSCSTDTDYSEIVAESKKYNDLYIFGGFGINTGVQVRHVLQSGFDGVIIGTAMLRNLNESPSTLFSYVKSIRQAMS